MLGSVLTTTYPELQRAAASDGEGAAQHGKTATRPHGEGERTEGLLTSVVAVAEDRGRGEAATVGEEKSSATGRKSEAVTALRGLPSSGEDV